MSKSNLSLVTDVMPGLGVWDAAAATDEARIVLCERCGDTGFERGPSGYQLCQCRKDRIMQAKLARVPPEFRWATLENIRADVTRHPMQAEAIEAMRADPFGGYFFGGRFGCGKSLLMWTLYREAVVSGVAKVVCCTLAELLSEYTAFIGASRNGGGGTLPRLNAAELRQEDVRYSIFLDDIDKARPSEYAAEQLFEIINAAYEFKHQIVVTTNLGIAALVDHFDRADERFGGAIVRRLIDGARRFEMF